MKNNIFIYILMHIGFLIYSCYSLVGKISSSEPVLSPRFFAFYALVVFILFIYALIWQQVLKHIPLSTAIANKSVTIIWGIVFGLVFFGESVSAKKIAGAAVILAGLILLSLDEKHE
jgi:drug/metabolite transporter (DMT)-like permease